MNVRRRRCGSEYFHGAWDHTMVLRGKSLQLERLRNVLIWRRYRVGISLRESRVSDAVDLRLRRSRAEMIWNGAQIDGVHDSGRL